MRRTILFTVDPTGAKLSLQQRRACALWPGSAEGDYVDRCSLAGRNGRKLLSYCCRSDRNAQTRRRFGKAIAQGLMKTGPGKKRRVASSAKPARVRTLQMAGAFVL